MSLPAGLDPVHRPPCPCSRVPAQAPGGEVRVTRSSCGAPDRRHRGRCSIWERSRRPPLSVSGQASASTGSLGCPHLTARSQHGPRVPGSSLLVGGDSVVPATWEEVAATLLCVLPSVHSPSPAVRGPLPPLPSFPGPLCSPWPWRTGPYHMHLCPLPAPLFPAEDIAHTPSTCPRCPRIRVDRRVCSGLMTHKGDSRAFSVTGVGSEVGGALLRLPASWAPGPQVPLPATWEGPDTIGMTASTPRRQGRLGPECPETLPTRNLPGSASWETPRDVTGAPRLVTVDFTAAQGAATRALTLRKCRV